jgi:hypothetical protein
MTTDTVDDMNDPQSNAIQENDEMTVPAATFQEPTVTYTVADDTDWGDEADLLPDGAGGPGNDERDTEGPEEIDLSDLRVNLSKQEAEAESFPDLVAGKYRVAIFKIQVQRSKSSKNAGKPMYNVTYKVQDGQHKGAQIFGDYWCLWEGAMYTYVQAVKALGYPVSSGSLRIIPAAELTGKTLIVRLGMGKSNTVLDPVTGESKTYDARLQVKGYFPDKSSNSITQANSLAP